MARKKSMVFGVDEAMQQLAQLSRDAEKLAAGAVYVGAGIVADQVKANINALPIDERFHSQDRPAETNIHGAKRIQKIGLQKSLGIAPIENDGGYINTSIGFDGYNLLKTKRYPQGQPNAMIARALESGTSFSDKIPFMSKAVRASRREAETAMAETFENEIKKITKG